MSTQTALREIPRLPADVVATLHAHWIETAEDVLSLAAAPATRLALLKTLACQEEELEAVVQDCRAALGIGMESTFGPSRPRPLGYLPDAPAQLAAIEEVGGGARFQAPGLPDIEAEGIPRSHHLLAAMQPVQDQGERGSCVAFAGVAAREHLAGDGVKLSEQFLHYLCTRDNGELDGTHPDRAAYELKQFGVCPESFCSYNPVPTPGDPGQDLPPDEAWEAAREYLIATFASVPANAARRCLTLAALLLGFESEGIPYAGRPVLVGLPVYESWWSAETVRTGRIYRRLGGEPCVGAHAMCIVGYVIDDKVPGGGFFIVRNSWSKEWAPESPVAAGHALVSFRYIEEAPEDIFCATALFSLQEMTGASQPARGRDALVAHGFENAERAYLAAFAEKVQHTEAVRETICEREFDQDQVLRRECLTERTILRYSVSQCTLLIPDQVTNRRLAGKAAAGWAFRQLHSELLALSAGRRSLAELCHSASGVVPQEQWVRCYLEDGTPAIDSLVEAGIPVARPFQHLPLVEASFPPTAGLDAVLEERFGLCCALPETPFGVPEPVAFAEAADLHAASWFGVPEEAAQFLGGDVDVGLVDSGVDLTHPDLAHLQPANCQDFSGDGDARDYSGHGTHCASILGGTGEAMEECIGIAPKARLHMAKVFPRSGRGASFAAILEGLDWLMLAGVKVISLSMGNSDSPNGQSQFTRTCEHLSTVYDRLVCVSAGNSGSRRETITPPGDAASAVTVAAMDASRYLAPFSSRGSADPAAHTHGMPNVAGPGVQVVAARSRMSQRTPWHADGRYTAMSGTSMACPAVAGLCALLWSACDEGKDDHQRRLLVTAALYESCDRPLDGSGVPYSSIYEVGHGIPDPVEALSILGWDESNAAGSEPVTATPSIPAGTKCSWLGIPLDPGWTVGEQCFICGSDTCESLPEDRWISKLAWDRLRDQAGERRWCRHCLNRDGVHSANAGIVGELSLRQLGDRFRARLAELKRTVGVHELNLCGSKGLKLSFKGAVHAWDLPTADAPFYVAQDGNASQLIWGMSSMAPARRGLLSALRSSGKQSVALGVLTAARVDLATARDLLRGKAQGQANAAPASWRDADLRVLALATDQELPVERHDCGFLVPLCLDGHWHPPQGWPEGDGEEFANLLALETAEERVRRGVGLVLRAAARRLAERPGSEAVIVSSPELAEFWTLEWVEILGQQMEGKLKPVADRLGHLQAVRLENAQHWLEVYDKTQCEPEA